MRPRPAASRPAPYAISPEERAPLAARWLQTDASGTPLRDATLARLRAEGQEADGSPGPDRDLRAIPLAQEDLSGIDFSGFDLRWADLSGCDLKGTRLGGADLRGAVLMGANLEGAELLNCDLRGADLSECAAPRAGLAGANLEGVTLFGARLPSATLSRANLEGADLRTADLTGCRIREARLSGANLDGAVLRGADLGLCRVAAATFDHSDLRSARLRALRGFRAASWIGVDTRDVDFTGAYLLRRHILDENYLYEFRTRGRATALLYRLWWLTSDCGRSLLRWTALNLALMVAFAGLYGLVDLDLGAHPTPLSRLYYSVVTFTTLGYGDVQPASTAAQVVAIVEVLCGYVGLGGLLSILSNKMARRAD